MSLHEPSLLVYTFAFKERLDDKAEQYLLNLWSACTRPQNCAGRSGLGMTQSDPNLSHTGDFLGNLRQTAYDFRALVGIATPQSDGEAEFAAAYLFEYHDIIGLVALLSPDSVTEPQNGWKFLLERWRQATNCVNLPSSILVEAYVFTALCDEDLELSASDNVQKWLPGNQEDWRETPIYRSENKICFWEGHEVDRRRILALIAPDELDPTVSDWAFWGEKNELAVLARCLLHAAKIDEETRVYRHGMPEMRDQEQCINGMINEILQLHVDIETHKQTNIELLMAAQSRLSLAQTAATGLLVRMTRLKELRRTIAIAISNLRAALPPAHPKTDRSSRVLFAQELAQAEWLQKQIVHDLGYLQSTRERAQEVYALTGVHLEQARTEAIRRSEKTLRRQSEMMQKADRKHHQMDVFQTILIGALLVSLDAMHAFHTEVPLPQKLHWPLICMLVALAYTIPMIILHWPERYRWPDYLGGVFFGATLGWFLTALFWQLRHHSLSPFRMTLGVALLTGCLLILPIWALQSAQDWWMERHPPNEIELS